ncbi:hypothetical protein KOR34_28730 [Posidoniimonas corsicana]|uniref:PEP-CTERM protein-sorting domain-containing protein n=1 Tax=Posidoniimonas corsicana TaxID=1938618 RepID=A0A5C5VIW8_9BACT|nr:hypothetical protein [Posidoniimonas corsicana]TWT37907.1 hypothetical protein KOR34_28730 [Posidoniimonas corsicana]
MPLAVCRPAALLISLAAFAAATTSSAQIISLNFSENPGNQAFAGGELIGPLGTDSANWNSTSDPVDAGSISGLVDSAGASTSASVSWLSTNVWYNGDGTGDDQHRLSVGYLDDGTTSEGVGVDITFSNIPYTNYRVYGLLASDAGASYTAADFNVNGSWVFGDTAAATAPAYGSINASFDATGSYWSPANGVAAGNYWTFDTSGSTLTIQGAARVGGERGSLTGVVIRDLDAVIYDPALKLVVDRDSGGVTIENFTGADVDFAGLAALSASGALTPSNWLSVTDDHGPSPGDGSVSSDEWLKISATEYELSEATLGAGSIEQGGSIDLGVGTWLVGPYEDLRFEYLDLATGTTTTGLVEFVGNDDTPVVPGDYNVDGVIDAADWPTQRDAFGSDLAGASPARSYASGDLDGDGDNDLDDLLLFKGRFEAANPGVAFSTLTGVPEPASAGLMIAFGAALGLRRLRRVGGLTLALAATVLVLHAGPRSANAQIIGVSFSEESAGELRPNQTMLPADLAGVAGWQAPNWNNALHLAANNGVPQTLAGLIDDGGGSTGATLTWSAANSWGDGTATADADAGIANAKLMRGYLDDGATGDYGVDIEVTGIPYDSYRVALYFTSDFGDQHGAYTVNGQTYGPFGELFTWGESPTLDAGRNVAVIDGLSGSTLDIEGAIRNGNVRGSLAGLQIIDSTVDADLYSLSLVVNTDTGIASIVNKAPGGIPFDIDYFEVSSEAGLIDESGWAPLGSGGDDGSDWEALGNLDDSFVAQFYLTGSETIANQSLGRLFKTGSADPDLEFRFHTADSGLTLSGRVEYVTGGLPGDYNGDSVVNAADYTVWRDNLGAADESALYFNGDGGGVTASDYDFWKANYGSTASVSAADPTPEPGAAVLVAAVGLIGLTRRRPRTGGATKPTRAWAAPSLAACVLLAASATAHGAKSNDREYYFGEDSLEGASQGQEIGSSNSGALQSGRTADSIGPSGAYLDLAVTGGSPKYENVAPNGLARPGAAAGEYGARFDGDDYLTGVPLNRPDEISSLGCCGNYPLNYDGITGHGLQLWVYPEAASLGSAESPAEFQSIVFDTLLSGGPAINAQGQWTQINSVHGDGADGVAPVPATISVAAGDTWYHVMHQHYYVDGDQFLSVVYVDGVVVSANLDTIGLGGTDNTTEQLVVGAAQIPSDGVTPAYDNYFNGVVDDLEMYVYGDNSAQGGANYGEFNLFEDNAWIAEQIATTVPGGVLAMGDINKDGVVNGDGSGPADSDDISAFIAGWRSEQVLPGAHSNSGVGDWLTWEKGDLNLDGVTNFDDWFLLRASHPDAAALSLSTLLGQSTAPEPGALLLAASAALGMLPRRWSRA